MSPGAHPDAGSFVVWRKMDHATLDNIRIREAALTGHRLRVVADLAAAYPASVGLTSFTRTFTWDGGHDRSGCGIPAVRGSTRDSGTL